LEISLPERLGLQTGPPKARKFPGKLDDSSIEGRENLRRGVSSDPGTHES